MPNTPAAKIPLVGGGAQNPVGVGGGSLYANLGLDNFKVEIPALNDPHLLLGVTKRTAWAMKSEVMSGYDRATWFASKSKEDFITKYYGTDETGYDVAEAAKCWLASKGYQHLSVAEAWLLEGRSGVGRATMFLSHTQLEIFDKTMRANGYAIDSNEFLWLDYLVLRQCQRDFEPEFIHAVIDNIGNTLAVEDGEREKKATYLKRSFCLFEVACTPQDALHFPISARRAMVNANADPKFSSCQRIGLSLLSAGLMVAAWCLFALSFASWFLAAIPVTLNVLGGIIGCFVMARLLGTVDGDYSECASAGWIFLGGLVFLGVIISDMVLFLSLNATDADYTMGVVGLGLLLIGSVLYWNLTWPLFFTWQALRVNSKQAQATRKEDKQFVDGYIRDHFNGFRAVNNRTRKALREYLRRLNQ